MLHRQLRQLARRHLRVYPRNHPSQTGKRHPLVVSPQKARSAKRRSPFARPHHPTANYLRIHMIRKGHHIRPQNRGAQRLVLQGNAVNLHPLFGLRGAREAAEIAPEVRGVDVPSQNRRITWRDGRSSSRIMHRQGCLLQIPLEVNTRVLNEALIIRRSLDLRQSGKNRSASGPLQIHINKRICPWQQPCRFRGRNLP